LNIVWWIFSKDYLFEPVQLDFAAELPYKEKGRIPHLQKATVTNSFDRRWMKIADGPARQISFWEILGKAFCQHGHVTIILCEESEGPTGTLHASNWGTP
jgi:hypothetical protein